MQRQADIEMGQLPIANNPFANNLRNLATLIKQIDDYKKSLIENEAFQLFKKTAVSARWQHTAISSSILIGGVSSGLTGTIYFLHEAVQAARAKDNAASSYYGNLAIALFVVSLIITFCAAQLPARIMKDKIFAPTIKEINLEDDLNNIRELFSLINFSAASHPVIKKHTKLITRKVEELHEDMSVEHAIVNLTSIRDELASLHNLILRLSQPLFAKEKIPLTLFSAPANKSVKEKIKKEDGTVYTAVAVNDDSDNEKGKGKEKVNGAVMPAQAGIQKNFAK